MKKKIIILTLATLFVGNAYSMWDGHSMNSTVLNAKQHQIDNEKIQHYQTLVIQFCKKQRQPKKPKTTCSTYYYLPGFTENLFPEAKIDGDRTTFSLLFADRQC